MVGGSCLSPQKKNILIFLSMTLHFFLIFMVFVSSHRLFVMLRRFPIESRGRQKKMHEVNISTYLFDYYNFGACCVINITLGVGFVTGICCSCFLIRCIMVAIAAFDKNADIHRRHECGITGYGTCYSFVIRTTVLKELYLLWITFCFLLH
ncbi:protein of unknown function DUF1084 [Cynara cardunculus var. scolymus]|uniref:THH1/TOM1/TOM3 domain-containing protein n=1 Tax=Cynara cardunculus var. scolymus TaxID=59895 RepID=A0A118JW43_CYNCS|nr:protein of unknown function DUF1084 [Cynara cardunculus var. scolymus]